MIIFCSKPKLEEQRLAFEAELQKEREKSARIQRELKESMLAQQNLIDQQSINIRGNVVCRVCQMIFVDPVELPCFN